jgi:hypothetical protein
MFFGSIFRFTKSFCKSKLIFSVIKQCKKSKTQPAGVTSCVIVYFRALSNSDSTVSLSSDTENSR